MDKSLLYLITEEYVNSSEDLLKASKELESYGENMVSKIRPLIDGPFAALQIKEEIFKEFVKKFGTNEKTKNFILNEMKEISKSNREIATIIRARIKEIPA